MRIPGTVLAAALVATPFLAQAQPIQGLYIGAAVGADLPQNVRAIPSVGGNHLRLKEKLGFDALGSVGYGLGNGFRFEIQGDFRRNGINSLERTPFPNTVSGSVRSYGVMANALFDMDIGVPWLYPYVGGGVGYQWIQPGSQT